MKFIFCVSVVTDVQIIETSYNMYTKQAYS